MPKGCCSIGRVSYGSWTPVGLLGVSMTTNTARISLTLRRPPSGAPSILHLLRMPRKLRSHRLLHSSQRPFDQAGVPFANKVSKHDDRSASPLTARGAASADIAALCSTPASCVADNTARQLAQVGPTALPTLVRLGPGQC